MVNTARQAEMAAVVTARMVEAKRLRRQALAMDEDYYDLLCTYNRLWDASDGRDIRLPLIAVDLDEIAQAMKAKLDEAARLLGERR